MFAGVVVVDPREIDATRKFDTPEEAYRIARRRIVNNALRRRQPALRAEFVILLSPQEDPASAGRNRLPAGVALGYVGVIAGRVGAIIPHLGIRLAVVGEAVIRIKAKAREALVKPVKVVEPAPVKSAAMKSAAVKPTAVKPTAMKPAPAVETSAPAMHLSVGEIWQAKSGSAQQSSCDRQSSSYPGPGSMFA